MPARIHGFGRNSYHVAETLQRGLVPIHVYSDRPWLPYERIFESCGFATSVFGLPWLLWRLASLSDAELLAREARALQLAASHFGLAGVGAQLQAWLLDEPSDLLCTRLPSTVRDEEAYPAALALGAAGVLLAVYACAKCCASRRCAVVDSMNSASRVEDSRTELTLGSRDEQRALLPDTRAGVDAFACPCFRSFVRSPVRVRAERPYVPVLTT